MSVPTTPTDTYDRSGCPAGFAVAAKAGDLAAIQAAADWFRERGNPSGPNWPNQPDQSADVLNAYELEAIRGELAIQQTHARHLRRMLDLMPEAYPCMAPAPGFRLSVRGVEQFLRDRGLMVFGVNSGRFCVRMENGVWTQVTRDEDHVARNTYRIMCYTDHIEEELTRERLHKLLSVAWPRTVFVIVFGQFWFTEIGWNGRCALSLHK